MKFRRVCGQLIPVCPEALALYHSLANGDVIDLEVSVKRKRTHAQNASLHLWCKLMADALNAAGIDILSFPWKEGIELPWTKEEVKDRLWRPVQKAMTGEEHTSKATTLDYQAVYEVLNRKIASETGIHVPWPCLEEMERKHYAANV